MSYELSNEQIEFFKENGYLILEDVIEETIISSWERDFENYFGIDITQPDAYPIKVKGNGNSINRFQFSHETVSVNNHAKIKSIVKNLIGESVKGGSEQLIIHRPGETTKEWKKPGLAHVDLIPKSSAWRFMLGYVTYGCDVMKNGGCFIYWPKSHRKIWNFIKENPEYYYDNHEGTPDVLQEKYQEIIGGEPEQFVAKKGTVMIWHSYLLHNGSMNTTSIPRIGIFGRWGQSVPEGLVRDSFGDIWENWQIS